MQKDISIVIPLYNKEKYIQRTLDSVLNQTFQNFECIIIDSSNDGSTNLVKQYTDFRIVHVIRGRTKAAQARNLGVQIAQSDFIAFLDADDEWQSDHLETLLNIRKKYPDAGLFSTSYVKLKQNGIPMVMLFVGIPKPPWEGYLSNYLRICSRGDEPVNSSSIAVPMDIFNAMKGFPEDLEYGEDQYLWGKIALSFPIAYSWNGLTIYHTEASDRICNEPRMIKEHPFSHYLKSELTKRTIPQKDQADCLAYIKRKRYSQIFSTFLFAGKSTYNETSGNGASDSKTEWIKHLVTFPLKSMGRFFYKFYNSTIHDQLRSFICRIYGCYNPGSNINTQKKAGLP
jgi:glycosyltransferase involved in cell wall biosynthesis